MKSSSKIPLKKHITVLHVFDHYLNITENWIFRILINFVNVDVIIASKLFKDSEFYSKKFKYIEFPIKQIQTNKPNIFVNEINLIIGAIINLYVYHCAKKMNVDLVHSHYGFTGWEYQNLARKLRVPHVISFYGADYEKIPTLYPVWNTRYLALFNNADAFFCEGNFGANILRLRGCAEEKIFVVHLGLDIENIPFINRTKNREELKLLQIASITEKKGHKYTLASFAKSLETCPNMSLTIVGMDIQGIKKDLEKFVTEQGIENKVIFLDQINFDHLYIFLKDYQVFIHPSCHAADNDCEGGAPVVLLDAQATGMPIISTIHCDIPDEVINKKTGILTKEKDIDALVNAIEFFYKMDNDEYQTYSQNARKYVENEFDIRKTVKETEKIYEELLKKS